MTIALRKRTTIAAIAFVLVASTMAVAEITTTGARASAAVGPANPVEDWSEIAEAAITAGRPPGSSFVLSAITHAAMYDAAVAVEGRYEPFLVSPVVQRPVSLAAAVATAAHEVLVARVPSQAAALGTQYTAYLQSLPKDRSTFNGITLGVQVAGAYVAGRANDGFNTVVPYVQPPVGPGVFEPVPPGTTQPPVDVKLKQVTPLVMSSGSQFRPPAPPALTSLEYTADFIEVRDIGRTDSAIRTAEQTLTARFWAENTFTQWSRTARDLALARGLSPLETARTLAMMHVAAGDAAIGCFEAKYYYNFWRPFHAITRADSDLNPDTVQDTSWTSLLTVNHPEYPSGHACVTGAIAPALADAFGTDDVPFVMSSTITNTTETYPSFSASLNEVIEARIWSGLHFRTSMEAGAQLGAHVADLVVLRFEPLG
jgi:PAP2 superfamily